MKNWKIREVMIDVECIYDIKERTDFGYIERCLSDTFGDEPDEGYRRKIMYQSLTEKTIRLGNNAVIDTMHEKLLGISDDGIAAIIERAVIPIFHRAMDCKEREYLERSIHKLTERIRYSAVICEKEWYIVEALTGSKFLHVEGFTNSFYIQDTPIPLLMTNTKDVVRFFSDLFPLIKREIKARINDEGLIV